MKKPFLVLYPDKPRCMKYLLILAIGTFTFSTSFAQTKKRDRQKTTPTSTDPGYSRNESWDTIFPEGKNTAKKSKTGGAMAYQADKIREYEERREDNAKRYKKMAKQMAKPQYSDPSYFGHKKPPKKRSPGKRKPCKRCGMVH